MLVIASTTGTGEVEIIWYLDLQLLVQSVPITTNSASSNPVLARRYSIQYYVITFVSDLRQVSGTANLPNRKEIDNNRKGVR
jgi:hypothetical protein